MYPTRQGAEDQLRSNYVQSRGHHHARRRRWARADEEREPSRFTCLFRALFLYSYLGVCSSPAKCPAMGWHGRLRSVTFVGSTLISVTYVTPRFPAVPSDPQRSPASPAVPSRPQPSPAVPSRPQPSPAERTVPSQANRPQQSQLTSRPECVLSRPRAHQLHLSSTDIYSDSSEPAPEQSTARAFFISRSLAFGSGRCCLRKQMSLQ